MIGMPKGHEKNERKRKASDVPRSSDDTSDENMDDNDISSEGRDSKRWIKKTGFGKLLDFCMTKVKSRVNTTVVRTIPAYIPWSDTLIGYEEKQTRRDNMFGEGEILPWTDDDDAENENDEAVHANSGKTIIENRDVDRNEVTTRSSADERLCINKAREEQTSKHMESNGDEPRDENNMMAEPEDMELDEMIIVCMAMLDRKIDQLGRRYKGIVAGITAAMEKYPNNPNIAELKVKLWKAMTTI
ncbi:hypothetical protein DCAR_0205669 [Daucus carota subsp. sativus]|uniref:Uncharacterized protein n=1 Tax=Daucus carota subsp. sativus TaxID=79200 RepID=A0A161Y4P2_DAUCS|nr:hypothetical protein DCAR_0205669 [Daucus carota subsp. sativus]